MGVCQDGTDGAFGAGSDFTEEEQKKRCDQVASLHEHVAYSELVSHRILDKTGLRQQSTFADGTCVEVDFSKGTYKITVNGVFYESPPVQWFSSVNIEFDRKLWYYGNYSEPCKIAFCECLHSDRIAILYGEVTT